MDRTRTAMTGPSIARSGEAQQRNIRHGEVAALRNGISIAIRAASGRNQRNRDKMTEMCPLLQPVLNLSLTLCHHFDVLCLEIRLI